MASPPVHMPSQIEKLVNLIPVGLKEAALDSPTYRASVVHFSDQIEIVERWLDSFVRSTSKLTAELSTLENLVNTFLSNVTNPLNLSEAVVDYDYTLLAVKLYSENARQYWSSVISTLRKADHAVVEPIKAFISEEIRPFKDVRRAVERFQREYDNLQSRYASQAKTKEPSSLREDAFQLHEARKIYLKVSLDFSLLSSQIKQSLDKLLVNVCYDQWRAFKTMREDQSHMFDKESHQMERVKGWTVELDATQGFAKKEIIAARKSIEESTEAATRPSRELEDYSVSTVPFVGTAGPSFKMERGSSFAAEKQGWLYLRVFYGKPSRTTWVRRWTFVSDGMFGCLIQGSKTGGVEESERTGVLLCSIRPAFNEERRFCFEVKTKDNTMVLQAETQKDLVEWIGSFETAKRAALERPSPAVSIPGRHHVQDPAFAISQPPAVEFTAEQSETLTANTNADPEGRERASMAIERERDGPHRSSTENSRRTMTLERESEQNNRDYSSRLMQKLDIHRKTNTNPPSQGGIASLITASQNLLPIGMPMAPLATMDSETLRSRNSMYMPSELPPSTFAPTTLVNPPAPTSMSRAAVIVSAERGITLKAADGAGHIPQGMMANLWGSQNWALLNKVQRRRHTDDGKPGQRRTPSSDRLGLKDSGQPRSRSRHKQTMSLTNNFQTFEEVPQESYEYPSCYPQALKTQDAQFRLLFPNVPRDEVLILVFRATFSPNDNQDFPGRAYVTTRNMFFYSNYLGLVMTTCATFDSVSEITAATGRDCDFLYLHIVPERNSDIRERISFKTFLEPLKLLENRMNYLINISAADEPPCIETIFKTLTAMEGESPAKKPSTIDAWDNVANTSEKSEAPQPREPSSQEVKPLRMGTYIDQSVGLDSKAKQSKDTPFFRLPAHPVQYVPQGDLFLASESMFDVSTKALFHVIFGDRSNIWYVLQHRLGGKNIHQGPWLSQGSNRMRRDFTYNVEYTNALGKITKLDVFDYQLIDVMNDHLCYVITDKKTPWNLPLKRSFRLVTKAVLTHVAKSRSKLSIYTMAEWHSRPPLVASVIEKKAMLHLRGQAVNLMDLVTAEVRKLETQNNQTKKAIAIYGQIGHKKETIQFPLPQDSETTVAPMQHTGLVSLMLEAADGLSRASLKEVLTWFISSVKWCSKIASAHKILLILLFVSAMWNMMHTYYDSLHWMQERSAANFMNRIGVRPTGTIARAVYIEDMDAAIARGPFLEGGSNSTCFSVFHEANSPDAPDDFFHTAPKMDSNSRTSTKRVRKTRQRLGSYRHDLFVALRVINAIEKETLQGAWEQWVEQESRKCQVAKKLLDSHQEKPDNEEYNALLARVKEKLGGESIKDWYEDYCTSCQKEQQRLLGGDAETSTGSQHVMEEEL